MFQTRRRKRPDRRYRWTILALGTFAQSGYSAVLLGVPVLAPALAAEYDLRVSQIGVLLGCVSAGALVSQLPWGMVVDHIGERLAVVSGLLGCAVFLVIAAGKPGYVGLAACLAGAGASGASVNAASGSAVMSWFEQAERGIALGIRQAGIPLGGALAAVVLPPVTATSGVHGALLALGVGCVAAAVIGSLGLRPAASTTTPVPRGIHPLRDRQLIRLCAASGLLNACQTCVVRFSVVFLHACCAMRLGAAASALAGVHAVSIASRIAVGRWSDVIGRRVIPFRALAFAAGAASILLGLVANAGLAVAAGAVALTGIIATSWNGLSYAAASELAGGQRVGAAIGLQQTAHAAVQAISPIPFALLVDHVSWGAAFVAAGLAAVAAGALLTPLARIEARGRYPMVRRGEQL